MVDRLPLRLDNAVRPNHYSIRFDLDLTAGTWVGQTVISGLLLQPADHIRLHSVRLDITDVRINHSSSGDVPVQLTSHPEDEQVVLHLPESIGSGQFQIELSTNGSLNDQLVGLYSSHFDSTDSAGATTRHALAVTQFESTHARRAFPCFDEPALKAVFEISVVADDGLLVVSNTELRSQTDLGNGRILSQFAPTIPMSTYLVALVVGPLEATPVRTSRAPSATSLRVVSPPGNHHLTGFALDVADAALEYFEDYYDIAYPGDKLDLVAVPDFSFGAMENLGCVTFREVLLLIDPDDSTQHEQQRVADVINHEIAHMWFGDLVTMRWWNGLWLNEAFATFMEVSASDAFRPEWNCWTAFGQLRSGAFDTDALASTRPVEFPVRTPADAEGMFDVLTYEKGCSVLRMLEQYLGAETFQRGVRNYLTAHRFGSTETSDLWNAIEEVASTPVRRIMDAWVLRPGHPEVIVEVTPAGVRMEQRRAAFDAAERAASPWPVPLVVTASVGGELSTHRMLLEEPVELELPGPPEWVQPNTDGSGFFRTTLPPDLARSLASAERPALERFVLLDDTWFALLAGTADESLMLDVIERSAPRETDPTVWRRMAAILGDLHRQFGPEDAQRVRSVARRIACDRLDEIAELVAAHGEPDDERIRSVRSVAFALAGGVGADSEIHSRARSLFNNGVGDPSLRSAAADVVARIATSEEHAEFERRWRQSDNPQDQLRYLHHLVDTPRAEDLQRSLDLGFTEVRSQDLPYLLRRALQHPRLAEVAFNEISRRWGHIVEEFSIAGLSRMLEGVTGVADRDLAERIESLVTEQPHPSPIRAIDQHLERMWVSVALAERLRPTPS
ncbi:MAG: hypothetical protein FJW94_06010 [Actinobacteria bacterium]|nr:hypothetical protein [Actinomycetota bacterium]